MIKTSLFLAVVALAATASATPSASPSSCQLPECKVLAGQEIHCNPNAWFQFHPHPTDRTRYIQCTTIEPTVMDCPVGTAWSQSSSTCVLDSMAPSCTADVHTCDCDSCYMVDSSDSSIYYSCQLDSNGERGTPVKMTCADGKTFNMAFSACT